MRQISRSGECNVSSSYRHGSLVRDHRVDRGSGSRSRPTVGQGMPRAGTLELAAGLSRRHGLGTGIIRKGAST
jgi:hypothetical protein